MINQNHGGFAIGCPKAHRTGTLPDGRTVIHIDPQLLSAGQDILTWARSLASFGRAGQVDVICASHVLEHLHRREIHGILDGWVKVLKPNGELRITVHNLMWIARAILNDNLNENVIAALYGKFERHGRSYRNGFTEHRLAELLWQHGLEKIAIQIEDHEDANLVPSGRGYYLKATARKPKHKTTSFLDDYEEVLRTRRQIHAQRIAKHSCTMSELAEFLNLEGLELKAVDLGSGDAALSLGSIRPMRVDFRQEAKPDVVADVRTLPFSVHVFDLVFSSHTLEHFKGEEIDGILEEWIRVLRPRGTLLLRVPNLKWTAAQLVAGDYDDEVYSVLFNWGGYRGARHHFGFTERSMKALLEEHGLADVTTVLMDDYWADGMPRLKEYHLVTKGTKRRVPIKERAASQKACGNTAHQASAQAEHIVSNKHW